jgi:hypothetical protein
MTDTRTRRAWPDTLPDREVPDVGWSRVHTLSRLAVAYSEARAALEEISESSLEAFKASYDLGKLPTLRTKGPTWAADFFHGKVNWTQSKFRGKPRTFAMFLLMLLEKPTAKTMGSDAYQKLTGKLLDIRVFDACAWYLSPVVPMSYGETGRPQAAPAPEPEPVSVEPEPAEAVDRLIKDAWVSPEAVDSNTAAILEIMDDLSTFKKEIRAEVESHINRANGQMAAGIKALEERVAFRLDQAPDSDIGSRVKALEQGQAETLRQAQTGARQAVEDLSDRVRADVSYAFDALAAEAQAASNPASNPLAALEQVKAALKAAGFTGTLTLTIE